MLYAVLIGINKYKDPNIRDLSCARKDAIQLGQLIETNIAASERQVRLLLDEDATKHNIMRAIGEDLPRKANNPKDVILLYFSGHGSPEMDASPEEVSRYLIPHNAEFEYIYATGIDMEKDLRIWFERIRHPRLIMMFVDACFSGKIGGRTFEGPKLSRIRSKFRSKISLNTLDIGEGRLMMGACDDNEVAREEAKLGHGIFTYYLLAALRSSQRQSGTISIHALYDQVSESVRVHTHGEQVPILVGRSRIAKLPSLYKPEL
jgi:uncharacterized caspase-like protein